MKKTQKQIVVDLILKQGGISRNTCLKMFITRLGAIIKDLEYEGWSFIKFYGKERGFTGANRRNYYYLLKTKPQKYGNLGHN